MYVLYLHLGYLDLKHHSSVRKCFYVQGVYCISTDPAKVKTFYASLLYPDLYLYTLYDKQNSVINVRRNHLHLPSLYLNTLYVG